jgi:hypothetical protein
MNPNNNQNGAGLLPHSSPPISLGSGSASGGTTHMGFSTMNPAGVGGNVMNMNVTNTNSQFQNTNNPNMMNGAMNFLSSNAAMTNNNMQQQVAMPGAAQPGLAAGNTMNLNPQMK